MKAIDLFAGFGGFTCGAEQAGASVIWAANHWPLAVKWHAQNHPATQHACQDLHQVDWRDVPAHDLLLASPAGQVHSRARGKDRPHHDAARSTAWAVVSCLEAHRPAFGIVENVEAFLSWALFPAWRMAVGALGYSVAEHVIDAASLGVPQNRVRMFLVLARSLAPLRLRLPEREPVPASSFVDFAAGVWAPVERPGRAANTLRRVAAGRAEHGERFLVSYYGSTRGGRSLERPIGTITTRDRWAVVDGSRMRMLTAQENRAAMGFPASYAMPERHKDAVHLLGNAVSPPVARALVAAVREGAR